LIFTSIFSLAKGCRNLAATRGRNPTIWFIAGLFFGLFALLLLLVLPSRRRKVILANQKPPVSQPTLALLDTNHIGKLWYFLDSEKQQFGPMSFDALSRAWREGKVGEQTYVWNEEMENWQRFQEVIAPSRSNHITLSS
jgi:hypothetical protein